MDAAAEASLLACIQRVGDKLGPSLPTALQAYKDLAAEICSLNMELSPAVDCAALSGALNRRVPC